MKKPRISLLIVITVFLCCACAPKLINNTNTFSTDGSLAIKELQHVENFNLNTVGIASPSKILTPEESRVKKDIEKLLIGTWEWKASETSGHPVSSSPRVPITPKSAGYTQKLKFLANGQLEIYKSDRASTHIETTPYNVIVDSITHNQHVLSILRDSLLFRDRQMMQIENNTLFFGDIGMCGTVDEYVKLK